MAFLIEGFNVLQTIVTVVGAGFLIFGFINLFEGYSQDNGAAKAKGLAAAIGGGGIMFIALKLIPMLAPMFA